jgi:hypothetical protein
MLASVSIQDAIQDSVRHTPASKITGRMQWGTKPQVTAQDRQRTDRPEFAIPTAAYPQLQRERWAIPLTTADVLAGIACAYVFISMSGL